MRNISGTVRQELVPEQTGGGYGMKKQVLIISGSPRKGGNSETLCDELQRGCQEAGHRVQKI